MASNDSQREIGAIGSPSRSVQTSNAATATGEPNKYLQFHTLKPSSCNVTNDSTADQLTPSALESRVEPISSDISGEGDRSNYLSSVMTGEVPVQSLKDTLGSDSIYHEPAKRIPAASCYSSPQTETLVSHPESLSDPTGGVFAETISEEPTTIVEAATGLAGSSNANLTSREDMPIQQLSSAASTSQPEHRRARLAARDSGSAIAAKTPDNQKIPWSTQSSVAGNWVGEGEKLDYGENTYEDYPCETDESARERERRELRRELDQQQRTRANRQGPNYQPGGFDKHGVTKRKFKY